jgi:hypothetical protein
VLLSGEWGLETDTRKLKIGDGVTAWNALAYNGSTPGGPGDPTNLSVINRTAEGLTIASSTGNDATVPLATETLAGLLAPGTRAKAEGAVQLVALTPPSGWSTSSANTAGSVTLTLGLPSGFSLPSNASQASWDTAYSMRGQWSGGATGLNAATGRASLELGSAALASAGDFATSAQGALAATAVQPAALTAGLAGKADLTGPGGTVPSSQLPGFVDDVLEFANFVAFPATGETGKLYISLATNRQYRWSGTVYVEIIASAGSTDAVPEGSVNLYFTTARGEAAAASWWAASASKAKLDGLATVATTGAYGDLSGRPTLGTLAAQNGTFSGTSSGTNTGDQDLSGLVVKASNLSDLANAATARSNLDAAGSGAIGSSGLTMATNRLAGRNTAGTGAVEEITVGSRLTLAAGALNATIGSVATGITGAFVINNIIGITQQGYDDLPVPDPNTQYNIVD